MRERAKTPRWPSRLGCLFVVILASCPIAYAAGDAASDTGAVDALGDQWLAVSDAVKESQPHWMTPLATVTPRLEQEYRYDQSSQSRQNGVDLTNYGGNKGLEASFRPRTSS